MTSTLTEQDWLLVRDALYVYRHDAEQRQAAESRVLAICDVIGKVGRNLRAWDAESEAKAADELIEYGEDGDE